MRMLNDFVLVRQDEAPKTTEKGLALPDVAQERPKQGTVVAVGPGRWLEGGTRAAMSIKAGNRVLLSPCAGNPVKVEKEELLAVREDDVIAVLG